MNTFSIISKTLIIWLHDSKQMAIIVIFLVSIFEIYREREKTNLFVFKYLLFCSMTESSASVCHVIHQNGDPVFDIPDQHHCGHFIGLLPLLVNKCKVHVQSVGNGGHSVKKKATYSSKFCVRLLIYYLCSSNRNS